MVSLVLFKILTVKRILSAVASDEVFLMYKISHKICNKVNIDLIC